MRLRGIGKLAARHGGMGLPAETLDQPHAEAPLELADLQAHRRLRQVQPARRGGEAAVLDHLEKGPQLVEVEAAHLKEFLIDMISKIQFALFSAWLQREAHFEGGGAQAIDIAWASRLD